MSSAYNDNFTSSYRQRFVTLSRRQWSKPSPRKRNARRKIISEEALQIAEKRRDVKGKGEKERSLRLNAEIPGTARRGKKGFLDDQCKWRETKERESLEICSRKFDIPREHFMPRWAQ